MYIKTFDHHLQVEQDLWTRKDCQEAILNTGMMPSAWELDPTAICAGGVKGVYSMGSVLKMMRKTWRLDDSKRHFWWL